MAGIGWKEILIIAVIVMFLFGARRLPELARSFRKSIDEFKKGSDEDDSDTDATTRNGSATKTPKPDPASKN